MILDSVTLYTAHPYQIGGRYVPPRSFREQGLGTQIAQWSNLKTSHDTLQILDVPMSYGTAISPEAAPSYIRITYTPSGASQQTLYGWVTGIEEIAGRDQAVRIRWEIDYWRTYAWQSVLNLHGAQKSRILRCPMSYITGGYTDYTRLPAANIDRGEYSTVSAYQELREIVVPGQNASGDPSRWRETQWVLVMYNTSGTNTEIVYAIWPASGYQQYIADGSNVYSTIAVEDVYNGLLSEKMGIDANNLIGAWLLPFCPVTSAFRIVSQGPAISPVWAWQQISTVVMQASRFTGDYGFFRIMSSYNISYPGAVEIEIPVQFRNNSINHDIQITDSSGQIVWMRPYEGNGETTQTGQIGWAVDGTSGYMYVRMRIGSGTQTTIQQDLARGMVAVIPLSRLPVNSNTWQSYNLSGQRQLDIIQAKTAVESGIVKSAAGSVTGAVEGALTGALVGAAGGPIGAGAGQIIGLAGSLISTAIGGAVDMSARQKVQDATDKQVANQGQSLLLCNDSPMASYLNGPQLLYITHRGLQFKRAWAVKYGYIYDYVQHVQWSDIDSNGGAWQIEDLEVTGPIPPTAREAIKQMFAAGISILNITGE